MVTNSVSSIHTDTQAAYGRALIALGAVVVMGLVYFQTFQQMSEVWLSSVTFRHGLVIIPISAWLIWRSRIRLATVAMQPNWWMMPLLLVLAFGWLVGRVTDVSVAQELAMMAMIPALVALILGRGVFRLLRFPLLYLFFAVPVGWFLVPPLMHVTAYMAVLGLQWTGIPVFQEGFRISVPTGDFLVADACSGIRYLIACVALGTLFAYLFYRSWWRRAFFLGLAFLVPIVANGIRAYGIILLAYLSDMRIATGFDHVIYGFIFFSFILLLMFWLGSLFREDLGSATGIDKGQPTPSPKTASVGFPRTALAAALGVLLVASGPTAWAVAQRLGATAPQHGPGIVFAGTPAWQGPTTVSKIWHPKFVGQHRQLAARYHNGAQDVELFVEAYAYPHQGQGVASSMNSIAENSHQLVDTDNRRVAVSGTGKKSLDVRETIVQDPSGTRLVWSWYRVAGHSTANRVFAKFWEALAVLRGDRGWAQWVSVSTPMTNGARPARTVLTQFMNDNYGTLSACLSPDAKGMSACSK